MLVARLSLCDNCGGSIVQRVISHIAQLYHLWYELLSDRSHAKVVAVGATQVI